MFISLIWMALGRTLHMIPNIQGYIVRATRNYG